MAKANNGVVPVSRTRKIRGDNCRVVNMNVSEGDRECIPVQCGGDMNSSQTKLERECVGETR